MARAAHEETASGPVQHHQRPPRPFDSDFVLDLPSVGSPAIRPGDGAVAYVVSRVDRETLASESHIERVPFGGGAARSLTSGPRDGSPRWSPDGSTLAFLRREEEGAPQIWLLPAEGGEAAALTSLRGGVAEFAWSPDGATIYCTSDVDPDAPPASAERAAARPARTRGARDLLPRRHDRLARPDAAADLRRAGGRRARRRD